MQKTYARVIIDISHEKVDRPFCYKVPAHLWEQIEVGSCVEVPFGKGNNLRKGYVMELMEKPDFDPSLIKEIHSVQVGVQVENKLIKLAHWIREEYGSTMIQALKTVLPVKQTVKGKEYKKVVLTTDREETIALLGESKRMKGRAARVRLLEELLKEELLKNFELLHIVFI